MSITHYRWLVVVLGLCALLAGCTSKPPTAPGDAYLAPCSGVMVAPRQAKTLRLEVAVLGPGVVSDVDDVALEPLTIETEP